MRPLTCASFLFALAASSFATAQATLITEGVPPSVSKIVTYDQGSLWPAAYARHIDGSVTAISNPWLAGGHCSLPPLASNPVYDMARLDALTTGAGEEVVMVSAAGLIMVRWDHTLIPLPDFDVSTLDGSSAAQNAQLVRAAPFAPQHLIALVTEFRDGVRLYRRNPATGNTTFVAAPPVTGPVLDLEIFRDATGAARLLIRNAAGTTCIGPAGNVLYSVSGSGGVFARWPQSSPEIRAAWIHKIEGDPDWQLTLLADNGLAASRTDLGLAIAPSEDVMAAFAARVDPEGDLDLIVKTNSGTSALINLDGYFQLVNEEAYTGLTSRPQCVPDLLVTHAGNRLRLVDEHIPGSIAWSRVDLQDGGTGEPDAVTLHTSDDDPPIGASVPEEQQTMLPTNIRFKVRTTEETIQPFFATGTRTQIQLVAWRQAESTEQGEIGKVPESNLMFELSNPLEFPDTLWQLDADVESIFELVDPLGHALKGWSDTSLYWLTIRLVKTPMTENTPISASEPVTLVTSMSVPQFLEEDPRWPYIRGLLPPGTVLPVFLSYPEIGGGVVGVIRRFNDPPPPPNGGIPSPTQVPFSKPSVTGTLAPPSGGG